MKKNLIIIAAALSCLAFASFAFATATISLGTSIGGIFFAPSNNVTLNVDSSGTTASSGYGVEAAHAKGDTIYACSSANTKMYKHQVTVTSSSTAVSQMDASPGVGTDFGDSTHVSAGWVTL